MRCYLGLGSNLGDRDATLQAAVDALVAAGVRVVRSSSVYETEPVGPPQPRFRNAVIEVDCDLEPHDLLDRCLGVEAALGRVRGERWGPRTIDVDLLTCDDLRVDDGRLTLPHPRMAERAFVLVPLAELTGGEPALRDGVVLAGPPLRVA
ncbi:MAG: 2-amino-4-hydroxy-6-hydroxymethyldihydropteridine diphosphokinase [Actinomycetota bacterium]